MFEKKRNLVEEIIEIWRNKEREIWLIEEMERHAYRQGIF